MGFTGCFYKHLSENIVNFCVWKSFRSVTEGKDAIGEVTIKVQDNGHLIIGHGASTDIIEASTKAYIDAVNKIVHLRDGREKATEASEKYDEPQTKKVGLESPDSMPDTSQTAD